MNLILMSTQYKQEENMSSESKSESTESPKWVAFLKTLIDQNESMGLKRFHAEDLVLSKGDCIFDHELCYI